MRDVTIENCRVIPPVYVCRTGSQVEFWAADGDVELYFPDPNMWAPFPDGKLVTVAEGTTRSFTAGTPGSYDYGVVCRKCLRKDDETECIYEFARANSVPRVIINR